MGSSASKFRTSVSGTLPVPDPEAKVLCEKQNEFIQPHIDTVPHELSYHKTLKTKIWHRTCWRSTDDTKIILGGFLSSFVTVLSVTGEELVYELLKTASRIHSGLAITDEKHLVCDRKSVYTFNITDDDNLGTKLFPLNELDVKDPIDVFAMHKLQYAILCNNPRRIDFFSLKNILMDRGPISSESIKLDMQHPDVWDTACSTKDGNFCVIAIHEEVIYMYGCTGEKLSVCGTKLASGNLVILPGLLHCPYSIQQCGDAIVVTCKRGDVHLLKNKKWTLLMENGVPQNTGYFHKQPKYLWYSVCGDKWLWATDANDLKVHVYSTKTNTP